MNKGMIPVLVSLAFFMLSGASPTAADIYKVVDENGNVTYTDQKPSPGAEPVDLPPLSVVETTKPEVETAPMAATAEAEAPKPRDLRKTYSDFRIIQPANEETFWGTANTVVVSWGSTEPVPDSMRVVLYVDGQARDVPGAGSVTLTLDRGEHRVYAELRDARNRRVITTDTVTFFVKQHSVNFGQLQPATRPSFSS
jgi:hypothetical protein